MRKLVAIPILPHLKKWINKKHNIEGVFPVNSKTVIGMTLMGMARMKRNVRQANVRYTAQIIFSFGIEFSKYEIRQGYIVAVNTFFDKYFKEEMFTYLSAKYEEGKPPFQATEEFLKKYDIMESEYGKLSAYRAWERFKNKEYELSKSQTA